MGKARSILDARVIEFDSLAIVLLACGFIGVGLLTVWATGSAANRFDAPVILAGAAVGAAAARAERARRLPCLAC